MDLRAYRESKGLLLEAAARELGHSKGYLSQIENRLWYPPLKLALRIEAWSGGAVRAIDLLPPEAAELLRRRDGAAARAEMGRQRARQGAVRA